MNHRKASEYHREAHKTRLYKIWTTMRERCYREHHSHYKNYGGRGITVLAEKIGMNKTTLKERLNSGWSVEDAVEKPIRKRTRGYRPSNGKG